MWNGNKTQLERALVAVTLVGMLASAIIWMNDTFATKEDVERLAKSVQDLRCNIIRSELNMLDAKNNYAELTEYDLVAKKNLHRRWKRECEG
jgi:S-adenosylmethionine synthetase